MTVAASACSGTPPHLLGYGQLAHQRYAEHVQRRCCNPRGSSTAATSNAVTPGTSASDPGAGRRDGPAQVGVKRFAG